MRKNDDEKLVSGNAVKEEFLVLSRKSIFHDFPLKAKSECMNRFKIEQREKTFSGAKEGFLEK